MVQDKSAVRPLKLSDFHPSLRWKLVLGLAVSVVLMSVANGYSEIFGAYFLVFMALNLALVAFLNYRLFRWAIKKNANIIDAEKEKTRAEFLDEVSAK